MGSLLQYSSLKATVPRRHQQVSNGPGDHSLHEDDLCEAAGELIGIRRLAPTSPRDAQRLVVVDKHYRSKAQASNLHCTWSSVRCLSTAHHAPKYVLLTLETDTNIITVTTRLYCIRSNTGDFS